MFQRRFRPIALAIALPASLSLFLGGCAAPEESVTTNGSALPDPQETVEGEASTTSEASPVPEAVTNAETAAQATAGDASPESSASTGATNSQAESSPSASVSSKSSSNSESSAAETQATEAKDKAETVETAEIRIDETVCGAGGQEAYFETKAQDIYICKNAEGSLTYIATPKRKGNSFFLPAQKIQQGDVVGYAAMDDTKTYIVTPGGFQLQDNGKPKKSEKVIRRQLSD